MCGALYDLLAASSLGPETVRERVACQNCLPQGLEPPAKPALNAAKPPAKPSTKSAAKPAAQVAAKPAGGEPIRVAPFEHVQLFRVKHSR